MTKETAARVNVRRTLTVAVPFLAVGLTGFLFFLTQGIAMHDPGLIVGSAFVLFSVAGLLFNLVILARLRWRL